MKTSTDTTATLDNLTHGALQVLGALLDSSDGNDDDFGFMDEAYEALGMTSQQFAGHVSHLGDFIEWREDLSKDRDVQCNDVQFGLTEACIELRAEIARRLSRACSTVK